MFSDDTYNDKCKDMPLCIEVARLELLIWDLFCSSRQWENLTRSFFYFHGEKALCRKDLFVCTAVII